MLFLSLGSNYNFRQAWRHLWIRGCKEDSEKLQTVLTERYQGQKTLLFSQGRGALSAAIRLATGGEGLVAVNATTCFVVIEAIKTAGCQPLYIDIEPQTLHFNAKKLQAAVKNKPVKAVIIQNTLGIPVEIEVILQVARQAKMAVIEDLAHAVGGHYADGREIGTVGDYTMLSFGRDKMLDTINGGALVIRTEAVERVIQPPVESVDWRQGLRDRLYPMIAWKARLFYPLGLGKVILALAYKLKLARRSADGGTQPTKRLPDWQVRLALEQVTDIDQNVADRLAKQAKYLQKLAKFSPEISSNAVRLPLLVDNQAAVFAALKAAGCHFEDVWYEVPISPKRLYDQVDFSEQDCPVATAVAQRTVNLPTHQLVTDADIAQICQIIETKARIWKLLMK